jgi:hypothetical protein
MGGHAGGINIKRSSITFAANAGAIHELDMRKKNGRKIRR